MNTMEYFPKVKLIALVTEALKSMGGEGTNTDIITYLENKYGDKFKSKKKYRTSIRDSVRKNYGKKEELKDGETVFSVNLPLRPSLKGLPLFDMNGSFEDDSDTADTELAMGKIVGVTGEDVVGAVASLNPSDGKEEAPIPETPDTTTTKKRKSSHNSNGGSKRKSVANEVTLKEEDLTVLTRRIEDLNASNQLGIMSLQAQVNEKIIELNNKIDAIRSEQQQRTEQMYAKLHEEIQQLQANLAPKQ